MFGIPSLYIKLGAALLICATLVSGFFYIKYLNAELETARINQVRLEETIKEQQEAVNSLRSDINRITIVQQTLFEGLNQAQTNSRELERRLTRQFSRSNLTSRTPSETERMANDVMRETLRCNEIATGSPLTEQEKTGQTQNTICPELMGRTQ
jgi:hypothetical protein